MTDSCVEKAPSHHTMLFAPPGGWISSAGASGDMNHFIVHSEDEEENRKYVDVETYVWACKESSAYLLLVNSAFFFTTLKCFEAASWAPQTCTFGYFHFRIRPFAECFILISRVCRFCHSFLRSHPLFCFPLLLEYCHGNTHFYCNIQLQFDPDLPSICLVPKFYEVDECLHICSPS